MDDREIIRLLFCRSETALDEISKRYSHLMDSVLGGLLDAQSDVDECKNDVLLAIWNSIPPQNPNSLCAYITRLSHRIGVDRFRYNTREKRRVENVSSFSELEECLSDVGSYELDQGEISGVISDFIKSLDPESEILFVRRYIYLESVASLAKRFEMDENHVSVKLYRARKKLKKVLNKEGITV